MTTFCDACAHIRPAEYQREYESLKFARCAHPDARGESFVSPKLRVMPHCSDVNVHGRCRWFAAKVEEPQVMSLLEEVVL